MQTFSHYAITWKTCEKKKPRDFNEAFFLIFSELTTTVFELFYGRFKEIGLNNLKIGLMYNNVQKN